MPANGRNRPMAGSSDARSRSCHDPFADADRRRRGSARFSSCSFASPGHRAGDAGVQVPDRDDDGLGDGDVDATDAGF
jgi:hypothetical protein